jgi:hypothetical protein
MAVPHISDAVRLHLAALGAEKKSRVLDVALARRELAEDARAGAPAAKPDAMPSDDQ